MKKFFVLLVVAVATIASPAVSSASVVVDDFSMTTTASNASISRTLVGSSFLNLGSGIQVVGAGGVTYTADSGTFGSSFANGVSFSSVSSTVGTNYTVALLKDGVATETKSLGSGTLTFTTNLSDAMDFSFSVMNGFGADAGVANLGGTLSAVPEPTSLILVGIACAPFVLRRKRIASI